MRCSKGAGGEGLSSKQETSWSLRCFCTYHYTQFHLPHTNDFSPQDMRITLLCLLSVMRSLRRLLCSQYPQLHKTILLRSPHLQHSCSSRDEPSFSARHCWGWAGTTNTHTAPPLLQPSALLWPWGSTAEALGANTNAGPSRPPTAAGNVLTQTLWPQLEYRVHCPLCHLFSLLRVPLPRHHFFFYWNSDKHWSIWITLSMRFLHYF